MVIHFIQVYHFCFLTAMNGFKLKAKGVPLNLLDNESSNSDCCSDSEDNFDFDDENNLI